MKAIIQFLMHGLWLAKGKFLLCLTASVLSTWGLSTVIYGYLFTERDFQENFLKSNQADIIVSLDGVSPEFLKSIRDISTIKDVERREVITGRTLNAAGNWMSVSIFGVEDIGQSRISRFDLMPENDRQQPTIYIERNAKYFLRSAIDTVTVQIPGVKNLDFQFGGFAYDPGQAPSQMEQVIYGYSNISNLTEVLGETQRYLIEVVDAHAHEDDLQKVATAIRDLAAKNNVKVVSMNIPPPGEHIHQSIVDGISFLQKSFGGILSMLGVILLSLILITWLYPQLSQIGVMKAMGASTNDLFISYFGILISIITVGLILGIPLGYRAAITYNRFIAMVQNFNVIEGPLPWHAHLYVVIPAVAIPLSFAIMPLLKVARTTVQNAIANVFYTPRKKAFGFVQNQVINSQYKYSLNNLFRSNQRTMLILILMTIGVSLFSTGYNLKYSIRKYLNDFVDAWGYEINIALAESNNNKFTFLDSLANVEHVAYVNKTNCIMNAVKYQVSRSTFIKDYPPDYDISTMVILSGKIDKACKNCVYIGQREEDDLKGILLGDSIQLTFEDGTKESLIFSGVIQNIVQGGLYRFNSAPLAEFSEVYVKVKEGSDLSAVAQSLDDALLDKDVEVKQIINLGTWIQSFEGHQRPTYIIIQVMGIITLFIGIMGMLIVLSLSIEERSREMGIMKALGGSVRDIVQLLQYEYLVCNTVALLGGLAFGYVLATVMCNMLGTMSMQSPITAWADPLFMSLTVVGLFIVQWISIFIYGRYKINNSPKNLLNQIF